MQNSKLGWKFTAFNILNGVYVIGSVDTANAVVFHTGVFEPPVDGVYVLTIYGRTSSVTNGPMYLRNNDDILCSTWITEDYDLFTTGTCTAVVELVVGDSVRVTGSSENPAVIAGGDSGFTGFIIS